MNLLFDQNLSLWLVDRLEDLYPNSTHVGDVGLDRALDRAIWSSPDFTEEIVQMTREVRPLLEFVWEAEPTS